ncbi:MAG: hypothetical protein ACSHX8_13040 [Opitutaceae bacterium]
MNKPISYLFACLISTVFANMEASEVHPVETEVIARMDSVIIDRVNVTKLHFSELLKHLETKIDKGLSPNFVQLNRETYDPFVSVKLENASVAEVITNASRQANYTWSLKNGSVIFRGAPLRVQKDGERPLEILSSKIARTGCHYCSDSKVHDPFSEEDARTHRHIPDFKKKQGD